MSPHSATYTEALGAYLTISAWWGGWLPITMASWRPGEAIWRCGPAGPGRDHDLAGIVRFLEEQHDDEIRLGVPEAKPNNGGVGCASMLWAVVEGTDQLARARRFKPHPALVLQAGGGSKRWLVWPLEQRLDYFHLKDFNRRIAYHLRAVQKHGDPDLAWFPAPGSCLREGRSRPVPVRVARLTTDTFSTDFAQRLKPAPELRNWWEAA